MKVQAASGSAAAASMPSSSRMEVSPVGRSAAIRSPAIYARSTSYSPGRKPKENRSLVVPRHRNRVTGLIDVSLRARLAQRCGDLLDAGAHFDRVTREACAGHTLPFRFVIRVREFNAV